jgi:hypothetical protein
MPIVDRATRINGRRNKLVSSPSLEMPALVYAASRIDEAGRYPWEEISSPDPSGSLSFRNLSATKILREE